MSTVRFAAGSRPRRSENDLLVDAISSGGFDLAISSAFTFGMSRSDACLGVAGREHVSSRPEADLLRDWAEEQSSRLIC